MYFQISVICPKVKRSHLIKYKWNTLSFYVLTPYKVKVFLGTVNFMDYESKVNSLHTASCFLFAIRGIFVRGAKKMTLYLKCKRYPLSHHCENQRITSSHCNAFCTA